MAARRRRGAMWRSSRRSRAALSWFADTGDGVIAPTTGVGLTENILDAVDYTITPGSKETVIVKRIVLDYFWAPVNPTAAAAASFNVDVALFVASPDERQAIVVAGVSIAGLVQTPARVIRSKMFGYTENGILTAVGIMHHARKPVQLSWNIRTNIRMREPQALYLYALRRDTDGTSDAYEYSYRSRVLFQRA